MGAKTRVWQSVISSVWEELLLRGCEPSHMPSARCPQLVECYMFPTSFYIWKIDFLRPKWVGMFAAICNRGVLEMNRGSQPLMLGDKRFKGEHVSAIVVRKRKENMMHKNERDNKLNQCMCSLCVFCMCVFWISQSALMASGFNLNHVSLTTIPLHRKLIP